MTKLETIFNKFFSKITDDMYMELSKEDTESMVYELFESALPWFEFPRVDMYNYNLDTSTYNIDLTNDEINIIATYMVMEWLGQQLASVELTRLKYSGSDFKFTSQANHMHKLTNLQKEYERKGFHLQRLYKRRKADINGIMRSTFNMLMEEPSYTQVEKTNNNDAEKLNKLATEIEEMKRSDIYRLDPVTNDDEVTLNGGTAPIEK